MKRDTNFKSVMNTEIEGQVERVTYLNEESGYTIAKLRVKGHRDFVTILGNLPAISPGEVLKLKGEWYNHPKYGEQVKVLSYTSITPATAKGIERYLGSGLIRGIGPVIAKRIVNRFGIETLDVIENSISKLKEIEGIGENRIEMIKKAWVGQKEIKEVMLFLQSYGVSTGYATKIFKHYGQKSIQVVRENPYRLAADIFGIGFITADRIAENMGIEKTSEGRAEAGILYVLQQLSNSGHVYYPYEPLIHECEGVLDVEREIIVKAFAKLVLKEKVIIEDLNSGQVEVNNKAVYLSKFFIPERGIARNLKRLLTAKKRFRPFDVEKTLEKVQKELKITLVEDQIRAVTDSFKNKVMVITGGPGTGKTTIIQVIIKLCKGFGYSTLLAAPTGRASKRMSEATGEEAKTIHRLLEFNPQKMAFKRDEDNPLEVDLIVIDEVSMVDTILMHHFLKALPIHATLILVGDVDQLPSVGAGNVLNDIIDSGIVPTVRLNEIFRQSRESLIIVNAHRVNYGHMPVLTFQRDRLQDFYFFQIEEPERIVKEIISLCKEKIPKKFRFDPVRDIQVLSAMNKGVLGVSNLNKELQKVLNPSSDELIRGDRILRVRDKVMQIVNNYYKDVFNGDIGIITDINKEYQEITVNFEGRPVIYDYKDLDEIVLAYAISVHKSQGSEYSVIVMPVHTQHYMLLQRNLIYTGISRGKRLVILIGTKKALAMAIKNNKPQMRYTLLKDRLKNTIPNV